MLAAVVVAGFTSVAPPSPLPRRPLVGVTVRAVGGALRIDRVGPGTPAERAGIRANDVLRAVDGRIVASRDALQDAVVQRRPHVLTLSRRGGMLKLTVVPILPADETDRRIRVQYESVVTPQGRRRIIVTRPKGSGAFPGAVLAGGLGCYTVSGGYPGDPYADIAHELSAHGIVVVRVEKSGVGDSEGRPCAQADFSDEIAGVDAATAWIERQPYVERGRVFGIGHSIGGAVLARAAAHHAFRGLIGIAVAGKEWFEYDLDNERRQEPLGGMGAQQIERYMRAHVRCTEPFFVEHATRRSVISRQPACAAHLSFPVSDDYMHQLADVNPPADWVAARTRVLLIWGTSDFITARDEHRAIVSAVNATSPGRGRYVEIARMDHYLRVEPSFAASFARRPSPADPLHPALIGLLAGFLSAR